MDTVFLLLACTVPFIDANNQRSPSFHGVPQKMKILLNQSLVRINQQQDNMSILNRIQRLDD